MEIAATNGHRSSRIRSRVVRQISAPVGMNPTNGMTAVAQTSKIKATARRAANAAADDCGCLGCFAKMPETAKAKPEVASIPLVKFE